MTTTISQPNAATGTDFLPLDGIDHVEFYVGNAKQAAHFYRTVMGFDVIAYEGLETGCRDRASYVLSQGNVRFVVSSALSPDHEISRHVALHGDGVKSIAFRVQDVERSIEEVKHRGATVCRPLATVDDQDGTFRTAAIKTYGDTIHTFIERRNYKGVFAPGYKPYSAPKAQSLGLVHVDHMVGNVELGAMNHWVKFYAHVLGFSQLAEFTDKDISTEYSALMSKVMQNGTGRIKFPINEPAEGRRKSQVEEYLDFYYGPGVQHVALGTGDIVAAVRGLRDNGMQFLRVPDTYYEALKQRVGNIDVDFKVLQDLGILADRDDEGYLLQIFSYPVQDRPTLFFEIIERHGSRGFGKGNFKALFVSLEEEQRRRGNL